MVVSVRVVIVIKISLLVWWYHKNAPKLHHFATSRTAFGLFNLTSCLRQVKVFMPIFSNFTVQ
ncbi:hypothetical protein AO385_1483 [Moraxella catarrhalis]|uniref:Uncharacterized protein n=1 Tax=Moraxella catarrhalis TaxID=480 RepID=A0A198UNB5_MORCA|nr:hypothetical protein AO383_1440 [Moraxella catarrhalis]OAU97836.1 hypothetical protein AO384_0522 [Moraxella catarrhalis]OAU99003.1 hypothetical protein AO385_1483 [Moraxella catarrhalis]OAU99408.1 hypothetical protein AO382_2053 [Moraxella catarrhalis]